MKMLMRLLVPNWEKGQDAAVRGAIGTASGIVGICANLLLFGIKLLAGILTGSVSITADAMNNLSDASGSILTLIGFRLASKPADEHHPYGHARFEYLSGLAVAAMIMLIGKELGQTSIEKILHPTAVDFSLLAAVILLASIGVKLWLCLFNKMLGDHIQSTALLATAADSRNDCVATAVVLIASAVEHFTDLRVDGIMGLLVAVFILRSGWELAKETISPLLGENANPELRQKIVECMDACPEVLGYHDLMVHDYGPGQKFASMHVEMDCREDPLFCHELIDDMERECFQTHGVHLVIHYDPVVTDDPELIRMKELAVAYLKEQDPRLSLHDFRMVRGEHHTNLIFDIPLPIAMKGQEKTIQKTLNARLNEGSEMVYHTVITFDMADYA